MKYVKNRKSRLNTLPTATLLTGKANLSVTEAQRDINQNMLGILLTTVHVYTFINKFLL